MAEKPKSSAPSAPPAAEKPPPASPLPPPPSAAGSTPLPRLSAAGSGPKWRASWQVPALAGAVLLLAGGLVTALMTAPKPNFEKLFDQAQALIDKEDFESARQEVLEKRVLPHLNAGHLSAEQGKRFHIMRARTIAMADRKAGLESEKNAELVIDDYGAGAPEGAGLEPMDRWFLADADVTLGRLDHALQLAASLPASERANRGRIVRRVVEKRLETPLVDSEETLRIIADFLRDAELPAPDRAWALARQAELLIKQGLTERAIAKLVQTMPSLVADSGPERLADLYLLLGKAYWETGALQDASRQLEQAAALIPESQVKRAEAEVLLARIHEQTHQPPEEARSEARQRYASVVERFHGTAAALSALLGLGEVNAAMGDFEASLSAYADLVKGMAERPRGMEIQPSEVAESLLDRYNARLGAADLSGALRYAKLAEKLFPEDGAPPDVMRAVAVAHRQAAEARLREPGSDRLIELDRLDPATREQARLDLIAAAQYFKRHADRVGISDNAAFGNSLWSAADSLDLAGDPEQAIPLFLDYVKFFPNEPRQAEARFRLGQSYESRGDYGMASQFYRGLVDEAGKPDGNAGPYADLSLVPLAQCLLLDADPANDSQAEQLLEQVVKGAAGDPTARQFRDALSVLGTLKRQRGDFSGAIVCLEEATGRFPSDPRVDDLRYQLADSYLQDARAIGRKLDEGMPDNRRQALKAARLERLRKGLELFEIVRRSLESRDQRRLSELERLELRNSNLSLGHCAFELHDFESAIHHYDAARERYPKDAASLVAMVQIVNSYLEMGDKQRADTANNRAMAFYNSLPESAWSDPNLPMSKEDWQRWLDAMQRLRPAAAGAAEP